MQAEAAEPLHHKRPMASLHRLVVLMLLGTARAPPPGNDGGGSDACAEDGSSATYTETISTAQGVTKRTIVSAGCPNHESYCTGKPANKQPSGSRSIVVADTARAPVAITIIFPRRV